MGSQALGSDRTRTYWTPPMERYFIDLMLDQLNKGNRTGHTFTKQAWTDMAAMFNENYGCKYDKDTLKGRYKNLWEQHNVVKVLLEHGDFAWDEARQMVIAADHDWDIYIKTHPDVRPYRTKPVMNYNDLCVIYGYTAADGRYSFSSHDVDQEDDIQSMNIGDLPVTENPNSADRSRTHWTPTMDRFFVDLMLDQVRKGNKIDQTFNKQAWNEMIARFNEKFDSNNSKNVLRSRYKILRKHYSDMRTLLSENGFALDDSRQMVVADGSVWDAYIKAHPDTRSCRTTTVPDFNDLCMIYGTEIAKGKKSRPILDVIHGDDVIGTKSGEGKDKQNPISSDRLRTYWAPPMDRYLIDLLLEQVHKGNKIENTFVAQAWTEMTSLCNAKFGSQHDKDVLKNRYKSLRKQQNDIKILLDESGFSWDKTHPMVRADESVWDAYMKTYPDVRLYRTKIVPRYNELCVICGNIAAKFNYLDYGFDQDYDIMGARIGALLLLLGLCGEEVHNQAPISFESTRTYWTSPMDRYFIELMLEQVHKGNKIDFMFTRQAWMEMITLFNARFGFQHEKDILRNRYKNLKKQYNDLKTLLDQSGFTWDENRQMVIADDNEWDAYLKAHPDARSYRTRTVPDYNNLREIYGNANANGRNTHCCDQTEFSADPTTATPDGKHCEPLTTSDRSRTVWTLSMDRYFIDLMLEQVHGGNKVDNTFNKKAWADMISLFNAKFESQHDKEVLKSRFKNLRKRYNFIRNLLRQGGGFSWDGRRQMVIADDATWDSYLKAHPDAQSYRTKILASFSDLCVIYGEGISKEIQSDSGVDIDSDAVAMKRDGVLGAQPSSAMVTGQKDRVESLGLMSDIDSETVLGNKKRRRQPSRLLNSQQSRAVQKRAKNGRVDNAISEMREVVTSLANIEEGTVSLISIENVMHALQAVPDIDEDLLLDACDLLEDDKKAKTFLALDGKLRKKWLIRKLRQ